VESIGALSENMLKANKNRLFETIFSIYNRNLLKRRFNSLKVEGLGCLINKDSKLPLIIYCNHSSWWDGLIAFQISRIAKLDSYLMMEEKNLKRFFLFRKLGAFSINRENGRSAIQSLKYSVELLANDSKKTLWIFPQGEILNNDFRPIIFYNGISSIIEKVENCLVASLSIRYEFLDAFKPDIFVKISEPKSINIANGFDKKQMTKHLSSKLTANLDQLKKDILNKNIKNYRPII
jgi:chlorobactene lauroyltransferase